MNQQVESYQHPGAASPSIQAAQTQPVWQPQRPTAILPQAQSIKPGSGGKSGKVITRLSKAQALAMAGRLKQWIAVGTLITFTGLIGLVISHPVVSSTSTSSSANTTSSGSSNSSSSSSSNSSSTSSSSSSSGGYINTSGSINSGGSPSTSTGVS